MEKIEQKLNYFCPVMFLANSPTHSPTVLLPDCGELQSTNLILFAKIWSSPPIKIDKKKVKEKTEDIVV